MIVNAVSACATAVALGSVMVSKLFHGARGSPRS
jgi:hypothetical protein